MSKRSNRLPFNIAIIGAGPSGLFAAELLAAAGHQVSIYDRMASAGRKFLMAGRGGLNLTHSEPLPSFINRYGTASDWLAPAINAFPPQALRNWCEDLGQETFIGSSGRVFPRSMKAAPLLRAWLLRLGGLGVRFAASHQWCGWENDALHFTDSQKNNIFVTPDATLLALGGASWPRLGSNGQWVHILSQYGIKIAPLRPANGGFIVPWSEHFSARFAGEPLKPVTLTHKGTSQQGELMVTVQGLEGGAIYSLSSKLRESIETEGKAELTLDLRPTMTLAALERKLQIPRGNLSLSSFLKKAGFSPLAINLLRETISADALKQATPAVLAAQLKQLPLTLTATTGPERAISSAGGIQQNALNDDYMLRARRGVFACGEMLDWEAPTGGYLLQACFSTAAMAAHGILRYCEAQSPMDNTVESAG